MTESTAHVAAAPVKSSSFWEDLIDIFMSPVAVFRRREGKSPWPPLLFVAFAIGIIVYLTFNTMEPIFDAEFTRNTAKQIAKNPASADAINKFRGTASTIGKFVIGPTILVSVFVLGLVCWIVGKAFGSRQTFNDAVGVAAWAYMPRVLASVVNAVQGLVMDPASLNSSFAISIGPARFFDPDATNPILYQVLGRFDLFTLWSTVLLGIGLYVTGKVAKDRAVIFAIVVWVLGALPALRTAYMSM